MTPKRKFRGLTEHHGKRSKIRLPNIDGMIRKEREDVPAERRRRLGTQKIPACTYDLMPIDIEKLMKTLKDILK